MTHKRFDDLVTRYSAGRSRRATLRGLLAGAVAVLTTASAAKTGQAGKAAKRRRRRRKRTKRQEDQEEQRRQRCLDACPSGCFRCFHTVAGEIVCDNGGDSVCAEINFCSADADCAEGQCMATFQLVGSSVIQPLGSGLCDYPVGLCSTVVACAMP